MQSIRGFIREVLLEKRAEERAGHVTPGSFEQLDELVDTGCYMHFSDYNKVGIYPKSGFHTPLGFYTYPLDSEMLEKFKKNEIPFASERYFVIVVRPTGNVVNLDELTVDSAIEIINRDGGHVTELGEPAPEKFWEYSMTANIFKVKSGIGQKVDPRKWNTWFRNRGIDGVYDSGMGIIHPNEPKQAVFFRAGALEHVATLNNPLIKKEPRGVPADIVAAFKIFDNERKRLKYHTFMEWYRSLGHMKFIDTIEALAPSDWSVTKRSKVANMMINVRGLDSWLALWQERVGKMS